MKKIFFALAALAMVFASCQKEGAESGSDTIKLNITVADIGPDDSVTKASSIKEVWAEGDQIYIWYDSNTGATPDLVITYDGSKWGGPKDITPPGYSSGYVKCLYDGRVKVASKPGYTYDSTNNKFSFNIDIWTPLTELVVVVKDIPEGTDASAYTLACDMFTPLSDSGYTVGVDNITATTGTKGDAATGFASDVYAGAAAFVFATADYSSSAQDFRFTLETTDGTKVFTENLTLESSAKIRSVELTCSGFVDHEAVQLWEDGPYWATTNIGACSPEEFGYYFAWGYPDGYVRSSANNGWVKADDPSSGITFDEAGFPEYKTHAFSDMAEANWGEGWRVPTKTEFNDLLSKCTVEYVRTGTKGIRLKGKGSYSGNSIFLPSAGVGYGSNFFDVEDVGGSYWSTTQYSDNYAAHRLTFSTVQPFSSYGVSTIDKFCGFSVRPVRGTAPVLVTSITLSKTETSIAIGESETLSVSSVEPSNATDPTVTWSCYDTDVANVDAVTGTVTAVAPGTATVIATANDGSGVMATCTVTVRDYQAGDYVAFYGLKGVVYLYDSKPYIISLDEPANLCKWSDAKKWCEDKGDGWYLPSKDELLEIYKVRGTLNATLSSVGGTQLCLNNPHTGACPYDYWSSTEPTALSADYVDFCTGLVGYACYKTSSCNARAGRAL